MVRPGLRTARAPETATVTETAPVTVTVTGRLQMSVPSMATALASAQAGMGVAAGRDWPGPVPVPNSVGPVLHPVVPRAHLPEARRVPPEAAPREHQGGLRASY